MAEWWESAPVVQQQGGGDEWWKAAPVADAPKAKQPQYSGSILPFSVGEDGKARFDSNAGVLGMIKGAFGGAVDAAKLPGDVLAGKVDPMSDEGIQRAANLATLATPVNPAVRAGDRMIPGVAKNMVKEKPPVPTAEQLKDASKAGYEAARGMGVDYSAKAVDALARGVKADLEKDGILAELAPKTHAVLGKLTKPPDGAVAPLSSVEAARRAFANAAKDFGNPTEQLAARRVVERLDEFLSAGDPRSVVAGPAAAASKAITDARGNYAAAKRSGRVTGAAETAELNAAVANSGQNLDNATRQRFRDIVTKPKQAAGFSPEELTAMEGVARGSRTANTARAVGNLLGGGGGLGAAVTGGLGAAGGAMAGGPAGAGFGAVALPVAGAASKRLAAALTQKGASRVDEMVRMRSPMYQQALAAAPSVGAPVTRQEALARMLLMMQLEGQPQPR